MVKELKTNEEIENLFSKIRKDNPKFYSFEVLDTDVEYLERLKKDKENKEKDKEKYETFLRLKKKFEGYSEYEKAK